MSLRSRKWKRSSFDSVAGNIRTPTLTRPKEIVPLQIERMPWAYPERRLTKTVLEEVCDLRGVVLRVQSRRPRAYARLLQQSGGFACEAGRATGFAVSRTGEEAVTTCREYRPSAGEKPVESVDRAYTACGDANTPIARKRARRRRRSSSPERPASSSIAPAIASQ